MYRQQSIGWTYFTLLLSNVLILTYAYPNQNQPQQLITNRADSSRVQHYEARYPQYRPAVEESERKFAEKPNAMKKVALDEVDDLQTNNIQETGFSWSNMLGMVMQMLFNAGPAAGPTKNNDVLDGNDGLANSSPWANMLTVGLKILSALLGGGGSSDNIDKIDNGGSSPMQDVLTVVLQAVLGSKNPGQVSTMAKQAGEFLTIVMNLLDALKTSFAHRSLAARSAGQKDMISDAGVAGLTMLKAYVRAIGSGNDHCQQKYMCDANTDCISDIGQTSIFCNLGSYAASFILERSTSTSFNDFYKAGRKGRSGDDCRKAYLDCNEV